MYAIFNIQFVTSICIHVIVYFVSSNIDQMHRDVELEDDQGRRMLAMKVFGESIRYMKRHCLDLLRKRGAGVEDRYIHWVLTAPVSWPGSARLFMREAAYMV